MPQLMRSSYQLYRKPRAKRTTSAVLLNLQLDRAAEPVAKMAVCAPEGLHVEMSSAQLDSMLDGLSKIKDQVRPPARGANRGDEHGAVAPARL